MHLLVKHLKINQILLINCQKISPNSFFIEHKKLFGRFLSTKGDSDGPKKSGGDKKISATDLLKKLKTVKNHKSDFDLKSINLKSSNKSKHQFRAPKTLKEAQSAGNLKEDAKSEITEEEKILGREMVKAVTDVSEILGGAEIKSELLKKLINFEKETFEQSKPASDTSNFNETLAQMKVSTGQELDKDQENQVAEVTRLFQRFGGSKFAFNLRRNEKNVLLKAQKNKQQTYKIINIYEGNRLNIFNKADFEATPTLDQAPPTFYDTLEKKHFDWLVDLSPRNGFEEMIRWTEESKMHPYPIDNEYGHFEKHVPFQSHVFLDSYLDSRDDPRVPKTGAVRQFLEHVILGLSKNPYMTVERKVEHIEWFKEYFKDKTEEIEKLKQDEDSLNV